MPDRPAIGPQPVHLGGRGQDEQVIAVAHLEHVEAERDESQQVGRGRDRDASDHGVLGGDWAAAPDPDEHDHQRGQA